MIEKHVWDTLEHLGTVWWLYIEPRSILNKLKKRIFFNFFEPPKPILVRISLPKCSFGVVLRTKICFSKNESVQSKIGLLEALRICLECSELKYLVNYLKTERQVNFWNGLVFATFWSFCKALSATSNPRYQMYPSFCMIFLKKLFLSDKKCFKLIWKC